MWSMVAQRSTQITPPTATPDQLWQQVKVFITSSLSIGQNMKNSLERRHIRSFHAIGRQPRICPGPSVSSELEGGGTGECHRPQHIHHVLFECHSALNIKQRGQVIARNGGPGNAAALSYVRTFHTYNQWETVTMSAPV
ncbi:hypothetical protein TNCV_2999791 [Trichonephila clavipes]|nr:hypothetical protein TNCV_2999791 [Trichonephila clavipes]